MLQDRDLSCSAASGNLEERGHQCSDPGLAVGRAVGTGFKRGHGSSLCLLPRLQLCPFFLNQIMFLLSPSCLWRPRTWKTMTTSGLFSLAPKW